MPTVDNNSATAAETSTSKQQCSIHGQPPQISTPSALTMPTALADCEVRRHQARRHEWTRAHNDSEATVSHERSRHSEMPFAATHARQLHQRNAKNNIDSSAVTTPTQRYAVPKTHETSGTRARCSRTPPARLSLRTIAGAAAQKYTKRHAPHSRA
jgi:hypothetical protein